MVLKLAFGFGEQDTNVQFFKMDIIIVRYIFRKYLISKSIEYKSADSNLEIILPHNAWSL